VNLFVSTHPFGALNNDPLGILDRNNINVELNPYGRKITPKKLKIHFSDRSGLIAGTEVINKEILDYAPYLILIARVWIGIDGIDL